MYLPMAKVPPIVNLSAEDQAQLVRWKSTQGTPQQVALRCRLVLAAAEGYPDLEIAFHHEVNRHTVALWRERVQAKGIGSVWEIQAGRGRKPKYELVNRLWQLHNLKPHLSRTFKLSRDPKFIEKLTDVVGLYLNPPQKGIVLCVDEKSQIQALDRTQPGLPLKKGRCGTMTHDYKRNGTATLFAALNVLDGKVIGQCSGRHRHQEFLRFLRRLDWDFPGDQELHLVLDNYGTHKTPEVERWLKRHPRFVRHFIPTSSSWVNLVERWFGELTEKAVRRGAFFSVPDLVRAIEEFLAAWNENPRPFVWTAKLEDILKKIERARAKLESIKPGSTEPRRRRKGEE